MTAMIIDASGVRPAADALEVGKLVAAGRFFGSTFPAKTRPRATPFSLRPD